MNYKLIPLVIVLAGCASGPSPKVSGPSRLLFLQAALPTEPIRDLDVMDADLTRLETQNNIRLVLTPMTGSLVDALSRVEARKQNWSEGARDEEFRSVKTALVDGKSCFDVFLMGPDDESVNPRRFKWTVHQNSNANPLAMLANDPAKTKLTDWLDQNLPVRGFYTQPRSIYGSSSKYLRRLFCGERIQFAEMFRVGVETISGVGPAWSFVWDDPKSAPQMPVAR